jgi:MerR family transcriptional regulator, redox-sensitive transcriptional activator SoxR
LQRLYINLDECIGCGCLSLKRCKLTNPEDRAGRNGPGARRWLGDKPPADIE